MFKFLLVTFSALSLILMPMGSVSAAQKTASGLSGTVTCQSVPSAGAFVKVEFTNGHFTTATTDTYGNYFVRLSPGTYYAAVVSMNNCVFNDLYQQVTIYLNTVTALNFNF